MRRDMARAVAMLFGGTGIYGDLTPGTRFRFPSTRGTDSVYEKLTGGWYKVVVPPSAYPKLRTDLKYRTGAGSAVVTL